ncbi:hypothetical protein MMC32_005828 [Xylographa parallela]|nr:hypothetical protein [Xylographa parallela]
MRYTLCTPTSLPPSERTCTTHTIPPLLLLCFVAVAFKTLHWCLQQRKRRVAVTPAEQQAIVWERERQRRREEEARRVRDAWDDPIYGEGLGVSYGEEGG